MSSMPIPLKRLLLIPHQPAFPIVQAKQRQDKIAAATGRWIGSLTIDLAQMRGTGGGGAAPPRTPLLFRGAKPDPPKGAPRPWPQRLFAFSRPNHLSGAELFPRNSTFLKKPLVWGSFAARGRTVCQKICFFLNKPLVPGNFAAWGTTFSQKRTFFV